jgi:HlyD family secretion protein
MSARTLWWLLLCGAIGAAAFWYMKRPQLVSVALSTIERGRVEAKISNTRAGTMKACRRAALTPALGGQVAHLAVKKGEKVAAGQLLLALWNDDLAAQLQLARSEHEASQAQAEEACLQADNAKREGQRLGRLFRQHAVAEEQWDQAQNHAAVADAACRAARARVQVSADKISLAQANLERTRLRAPFAGIVAEVNGEVGEFVTPSPPGIPMPPAVDLVERGCLYVSAPIDEVDAPKVALGMDVFITLDAFGEQRFPGKVRRIAPYVLDLEKQARTVEVEVRFADEVDIAPFLPGYSADVEIITAARDDVLRLPAQTLIDGQRVLVYGNDGILVERSVSIGLSNWQESEISAGLEEGERVALFPGREGVKAGVHAMPALTH